jgi:hypothetical protein
MLPEGDIIIFVSTLTCFCPSTWSLNNPKNPSAPCVVANVPQRSPPSPDPHVLLSPTGLVKEKMDQFIGTCRLLLQLYITISRPRTHACLNRNARPPYSSTCIVCPSPPPPPPNTHRPGEWQAGPACGLPAGA